VQGKSQKLTLGLTGDFDFKKVIGKRSLQPGSDDPLRLDTVFTIASMTKLLTSIALLQLHERGTVGLDQDISEHVPVLAKQSILTGFSKDGTPILIKREKAITLRQLLTHSSGAGYTFMDPKLQQYAEYTGKSVSESSTVDDIFDWPLVYQPGEGWAYGAGVAWAGKVLEKLTGQSLEEYMQENIFKPLGISRITFFPKANPALEGQVSDMSFRDDATGTLSSAPPGLPFFGDLKDCLGGEGAYADLSDYAKVLRSILLDDGALLKSETTALMFEPQLPTDAARAGLKKAMDDPSWAVGDFSRPNEYDWGFGGILVAGDNHPIRNRGCLIWSGAANLFWVRSLLLKRESGNQLMKVVY
jgi:CubicO group peptidase (beta-lactamase class C family)